eukprot:jgi/Psemu1/289976/fgenesh1_pg.433_\
MPDTIRCFAAGVWIAVATAIDLAEATQPATIHRRATNDLIEWIRSSGGSYNPKQEERTFGNDKEYRGIFAGKDITEGEILLEVPWESILGAKSVTPEVLEAEYEERLKARQYEEVEDGEGRLVVAECRAVRNLLEEVQKGETSDFTAHLKHLSLLGNGEADPFVPPPIPTLWSEEGRALLEDIIDHGTLSPPGLFTTLNHDWFGSCIDDVHDPIQARVAATVASHGTSGILLQENGILVPLLDNHHYHHRQAGNLYGNAEVVVASGKHVRLVATRAIQEGEQIFRPFGTGDSHFMDFETGAIFRDFGIVDTEIYPKYYHFRILTDNDEDESVGVLIDREDEGSYEFTWVTADYEDEEYDWVEIQMYMARAKNRLERIQAMAKKGDSPPAGSTISQYEWETAWKYHANLLEAVTLGLNELQTPEHGQGPPVSCAGGLRPYEGGTCPVWDGFDYLLKTERITDLDLEFLPSNPYGPSDVSYAMCNHDDIAEWKDYVPCGDEEVIKSVYQDIRFLVHPETKDTVMKLDSTVQQVSSYRPHYHEFAVHYPARFIETIKRVLFVGGGDSMVLHEVLKYPTLERVVGLELDQYVVRNSFRYFNTQPHFNDKRVEWWFGDGAKSLLMLPKEYFQSFDLVVVDLSETVMSFQVTDKLSIFQTLSLLLKPDGIMLKNGEYYMEKMSQYFDYTLQYFEYDVPFICDQGMVIGSNNIDFFNHTMNDHGVELLVYESQDEINEKYNEFYRFTEYRKNDARKQGKCADIDEDADMGGKNAGILMVVEAENLTHDFQSIQSTKEVLSNALKKIGFSILGTVAHDPSSIVVVMREGYLTARLFPEKSYIGFDIQLWGNFHLMETARDGLIESFGGTDESTSSFRIVTGGMQGTSSQESDRKKIGPRMVNSRNCEEDIPADTAPTDGKRIDLVQGAVEESLHLLEDGAVNAAVLCGAEGKSCKSLEMLSKTKKIKEIVPLYTCESIKKTSVQFSRDVSSKMAECEAEITNQLANYATDGKISLLVVDDSADYIMSKPLLGVFTSAWNRKVLFSPNRFVAVVNSGVNESAWRRNLLVKIREQVTYKPMTLVDIALEDAAVEAQVTILSLHDPDFFLHLKEMTGNFNLAHGATAGATMQVESVFDGLPEPLVGHFRPKKFKWDDYDPIPAKEQHAGQISLGRQSIAQFEIKSDSRRDVGPGFTVEILQGALEQAITTSETLEFSSFQDGIGDGLVIVATSSDGTTDAVVTWDGSTHLDVNLFSRDENPKLRQSFIKRFTSVLKTVEPTLSDTHPRGIGLVVSFPGHIN